MPISTYISNSKIEKVLNFVKVLREDSEINTIFCRLEEYGHLILIGGAIRDIAVYNRQPRDYDIIVNTDCENFDEVFEGFEFTKNRFGGYKIYINTFEFDVWSIKNNWAFKNNILEAKVENIVESTFYNIDSVHLNLNNGDWDGKYFIEALNENVLDIVLDDDYISLNPTPEINIVRAIVFKKLWGLHFSSKVENYILNWAKTTLDPVKELKNAEVKHYGQNKKLTEEDILSVVIG